MYLRDQEKVRTRLMIPAQIVLALIAFTNYLMIFYSCLGLWAHGSWLKQQHPKDLFCIIALIQNGIVTYATWTTTATLLNFSIVLNLASVFPTHAATASLCIPLLEIIICAYSVMILFSILALLVLACILLEVCMGLVVWRQRTLPLFREVSPEVLMSPNSSTDK
ncbi:hypothetical protein cypCar_00005298 [Cyprinus carpio]|nr:hypothetical protein cypCar_00005298 [Cyprinus carpio]